MDSGEKVTIPAHIITSLAQIFTQLLQMLNKGQNSHLMVRIRYEIKEWPKLNTKVNFLTLSCSKHDRHSCLNFDDIQHK